MKKLILGLGLAVVLAGTGLGQKVDSKATTAASNAASLTKEGNSYSIASGTQIAAQLQNSLNVEKAKVGDQVVLKTTKAIKQNGQVVVAKGSTLIGRVTEVQEKTKGTATSKIGILFDRLKNGGNEMPVTAVITSIAQAQSRTGLSDDGYSDISGSGTARTSTQSSGSSGGLLGGVGNTVGGVVDTTTRTVGGVTDTAGQTLGNTTGAVGGTLRGIQISQSANASVSGGSTLSLSGGNLRLDKGTTFNLSLSESTAADNN